LAKEFTNNVPELKFNLIKIFSFFIKYKKLLKKIINNIKKFILKSIKTKLILLKISKNIKPENIQSEII
jgi:hypothetical protein